MREQILSLPHHFFHTVRQRVKANPWLALLLGAVFIIALAYAFWFRVPLQVDARGYDTIGWNLARGYNYRTYAASNLNEDSAIVYVGPGYEFFLAAIYLLCGHWFEPVWIAQALLHTLNTLLVYSVARRLLAGSERSNLFATLGAAVFGFHPDLIQMAAMLMTETLFLFLMLGAIYAAALSLDAPGPRPTILGAVCLGLAILVRPTALLFLFLFFVILCWKKRFRLAAVLLLIQIAVIGPWTLRNYIVYNQFILTTTTGGADLWVGNNPEANGEMDPAPDVAAYLNSHDTVTAERHGEEEVKKFLLTDPAGFLRLQLIKAMKFFSVIRTSAWWWHLGGASRIITFILSAAFTFTLLVLGIQGMWLAIRNGPALGRLLFFWALTIPASVLPFTVETRYRYPMYPFLAILGAWALWHLWSQRTRLRSFWFFAGCVLINTVLDALMNFSTVLARIPQI
jgi:hypothetical protein